MVVHETASPSEKAMAGAKSLFATQPRAEPNRDGKAKRTRSCAAVTVCWSIGGGSGSSRVRREHDRCQRRNAIEARWPETSPPVHPITAYHRRPKKEGARPAGASRLIGIKPGDRDGFSHH